MKKLFTISMMVLFILALSGCRNNQTNVPIDPVDPIDPVEPIVEVYPDVISEEVPSFMSTVNLPQEAKDFIQSVGSLEVVYYDADLMVAVVGTNVYYIEEDKDMIVYENVIEEFDDVANYLEYDYDNRIIYYFYRKGLKECNLETGETNLIHYIPGDVLIYKDRIVERDFTEEALTIYHINGTITTIANKTGIIYGISTDMYGYYEIIGNVTKVELFSEVGQIVSTVKDYKITASHYMDDDRILFEYQVDDTTNGFLLLNRDGSVDEFDLPVNALYTIKRQTEDQFIFEYSTNDTLTGYVVFDSELNSSHYQYDIEDTISQTTFKDDFYYIKTVGNIDTLCYTLDNILIDPATIGHPFEKIEFISDDYAIGYYEDQLTIMDRHTGNVVNTLYNQVYGVNFLSDDYFIGRNEEEYGFDFAIFSIDGTQIVDEITVILHQSENNVIYFKKSSSEYYLCQFDLETGEETYFSDQLYPFGQYLRIYDNYIAVQATLEYTDLSDEDTPWYDREFSYTNWYIDVYTLEGEYVGTYLNLSMNKFDIWQTEDGNIYIDKEEYGTPNIPN